MPTSRIRCSAPHGTLWSERIDGQVNRTDSIHPDAHTDEVLGIIEYVNLPLRPRTRGTRWGWRPVHSGWTASRLDTMADAISALPKVKALAS